MTTVNGGSGDFRGTIFARDLMKFGAVLGRIVIGRNMLGTIKTNEGLRLDSNTIDIGGSTGLMGRVIIGANTAAQTWPWESTIEVGSTMIGPPSSPAYDNTSASLGGGTIGLVPFRLHAADSAPLDESCVERLDAPTDAAPILMRHYGAVTVLAGDGAPFILERRAIGSAGTWIDQSSCTAQVIDVNPTIVRIGPSASGVRMQSGYEYRVRQAKKTVGMAQENVLRCDLRNMGVPSSVETPPVVDFSEGYTFVVGTLCTGDADDSGVVDFGDVTSVLQFFGMPTGCLAAGDANRDGMVNFDDITDVLTFFGTTCETCFGGESLVAGPNGSAPSLSDALRTLGYDSLSRFLVDLEALDETDRVELLQQLGAALDQQSNSAEE